MADQVQAGKEKTETTRQRRPAVPVAVPRYDQAEIAPPVALQRAVSAAGRLSPADVRALQRTVGNRAVNRLLAARPGRPCLQAKLTVGPAGDTYEQEADRVAEQVMMRGRGSDAAHVLNAAVTQPVVQRDGEEEEGAVETAFEQRGEALRETPQQWFPRIKRLDSRGRCKEILGAYDFNWFTAKEHLAYVTYARNPEEYQERMLVMKHLLTFRKQETEAVLKPAMLAVAQDISRGKRVPESSFIAKEGDKGYEIKVDGKAIVEAIAPGSQSLTSDIDITFSVPGFEEFEVDLVQQFNHAFRARWQGVEAGVVFDVNAYSSGFMAKAAGHLDEGKYSRALEEKESKVKQDQKLVQLALGFLPIRRYYAGKSLTKARWYFFTREAKSAIANYLREKGVPDGQIGVYHAEIDSIFRLTEELHEETETEMASIKETVSNTRAENRRRGANQPPLSEKHLEAVAGDMLYEAQLHKIRLLLETRKDLVREIEGLMALPTEAAGPHLEACRDALARNLVDAECEQGKALVYANEAYYTAGAAIHVVKGMQSGGAVQLSSQQQMASLLMNIGYKLMHFEHNLEEGGQGRALVATAKYGERIRDVVKQGMPEYIREREEETHRAGAGGLYNRGFDPQLHVLLASDLDVLDTEKDLIVRYKKTKSMTSPAAREAKAQKVLGGKMTKEKLEDTYLGIAVKALGPYYENEFRTTRHRRETI